MKPEDIYKDTITEMLEYLHTAGVLSPSYMIARLSGALAAGEKLAQEKPTATDVRHTILDSYSSPHTTPNRRKGKPR